MLFAARLGGASLGIVRWLRDYGGAPPEMLFAA